MKLMHDGKDITETVTGITWGGDYAQASRTLDFSLAVSPSDHYLPSIKIELGDVVKMVDDNGKEYFRGYVFSRDKSSGSSTMTITCYDGLIYLLKNKGTYNFKNMTPQAITKKVCDSFGIHVGTLESGSQLSRIFDGEEAYKIIMTAYTIESSKTEKLYMPIMSGGKLSVILKGQYVASYVLDAESNLIDSNYSESMENSINRVRIYNDDGSYKGEVKLDGVPGRLQDIYKVEEGIDPIAGAKALLKGIARDASIDALGDFECQTGRAVIVKEPFTGLKGLFYIDTDTHKFSKGQHTMNLGLSFKNIMDSQIGGDDPAEIAKREAERKTESQASSGTSGSTGSTGSTGSSKRSTMISAAEGMIGFTYSQANRMGASSADCSSLVGRAMKRAGLTNNAQLTTRSISGDSRFIRISKSQLKPGDIVWEKGHMALFIGNNKLVEASSSRGKVRYSNLGNRFSYGYRIKGID